MSGLFPNRKRFRRNENLKVVPYNRMMFDDGKESLVCFHLGNDTSWGRGRWSVDLIMDLLAGEYNLECAAWGCVGRWKIVNFDEKSFSLPEEFLNKLLSKVESEKFSEFVKGYEEPVMLDSSCACFDFKSSDKSIMLHSQKVNFYSSGIFKWVRHWQIMRMTRGLRCVQRKILGYAYR